MTPGRDALRGARRAGAAVLASVMAGTLVPCAARAEGAGATVPPSGWERRCDVVDDGLAELSGLTVLDGTLYAIADGRGDGTDVAMVARIDDPGAGRPCAVTWITTAVPVTDVEDLAAHDGRLWLADVGDNLFARREVALIALDPTAPESARRIPVRPGVGPVDVEALGIGPDGHAVAVTKQPAPARVLVSDRPVEAALAVPERGLAWTVVGEYTPPPLREPRPEPRIGLEILGAGLVTGVAFDSSDRELAAEESATRRVAVRTYDSVAILPVSADGIPAALTDAGAGGGVGVSVWPTPPQPQGEAVALTDRWVYVASERGDGRGPEPLYRATLAAVGSATGAGGGAAGVRSGATGSSIGARSPALPTALAGLAGSLLVAGVFVARRRS